jgi:hypothetical protein
MILSVVSKVVGAIVPVKCLLHYAMAVGYFFSCINFGMKTIKTIDEVFIQILFSIKIGFNFARSQILQEQMHGQMTFILCVNKLSCLVPPNSVGHSDYISMSTVCGELTE